MTHGYAKLDHKFLTRSGWGFLPAHFWAGRERERTSRPLATANTPKENNHESERSDITLASRSSPVHVVQEGGRVRASVLPLP